MSQVNKVLFFFSEKLPDSLKRFSPGTQKRIVQWYKTARKNNNNVDEDLEDDDIDQMLLVIEWDEDGIRTRNIPKQHVIDGMSIM